MSKKRRLEWSFFLNHRNRITYNDLCRGCTRDCKQSFRAVIILGDLAASFEGRNEYISRLCSFPLLILDDFGMERGTEYGLEQVYLHQIVFEPSAAFSQSGKQTTNRKAQRTFKSP